MCSAWWEWESVLLYADGPLEMIISVGVGVCKTLPVIVVFRSSARDNVGRVGRREGLYGAGSFCALRGRRPHVIVVLSCVEPEALCTEY